MPTPSDLQNVRPRRSIFGNFNPTTGRGQPVPASPEDPSQSSSPGIRTDRDKPDVPLEGTSRPRPVDLTNPLPPLQTSVDVSVARMFLYRLLAQAFEDPDPKTWAWLVVGEVTDALRSAVKTLARETNSPLPQLSDELARHFTSSGYYDFATSHFACFGHTVRGDCPMNEIEYGDIKADPLFQPHRLADLGAFFGAFGLELAPDAAERIDHVSIELEFMSVLAAKEAHALEHQFDDDHVDVLRDAQKKFLREHLGRWTPAFARRLARLAEGTVLSTLGLVLGEFIKLECARMNIVPGSEDLLLRPVDDISERLCDTCGIHGLPPGAAMSGPKI